MIKDFLSKLWPSVSKSGKLSVFSLPSSKSAHIDLLDAATAEQLTNKWVQDKQNVYFGVCARRPGLAEHQRGKRPDLVGMPGLWLDIDILNPVHNRQDLIPSQEKAVELVESFGLEPTLLIDSGYGYHLYWLFEEPVWFEPGDFARCQKLSNKFQEAFRQHSISKGYYIDDTSDLTRILRLPGSFNFKNSAKPLPVVSLLSDGELLSYSKIEDQFVRGKIISVPSEESKSVTSNWWPISCNPLVERLNNLRKRESKTIAKKLIAGASLAKEGERDTELQRAASLIAFTAQGLEIDPYDLLEMLRPSVQAMQAEAGTTGNPPPDMDDAAKKLERAIYAAQAAEASKKEAEKKLREALARAGGRYTEEVQESAIYTDEQNKAFAKSLDCTLEEFSTRLIIHKGSAYYVFVNGKYDGPYVKEDMANSLIKLLAPYSFVQLETITKDGTPRKKTPVELVQTHGSLANKVVSSLFLQKSYFDPKTNSFYEACCPLEPTLKSTYNDEVHTWLKLLGGKDADKLLDWLATLTRLDNPTCALYLSGPRSTGKSMLTQGIASLWGSSVPTEFSKISESFNSDLARCPIVVADEYIPDGITKKRSTAELRQLIASTSRILSRKYLPNVNMVGAIRLIICANNDRLLAMGDEDLGQEDLHAVAERFLHIRVEKEAALYLAKLGGREYTKDWVDGRVIANHLKWLSENRPVRLGNRFLVEGHTTQMHKSLATQGTVANLVLEWIGKYLTNPIDANKVVKNILVGSNYICVNTVTVKEHWENFLKDNRIPTVTRIGRCLSNISKSSVIIKGCRYHIVDGDVIFGWLKESQAGNIEEVAKRVSTPLDSDILIALVDKEPSYIENGEIL